MTGQTTQPAVAKSHSPASPLWPRAIAFVAGACVMIVELVAGNVVAGWLGASLYTWTAVIAIILLGVALGNYLGGRAADRWRAGRLLGVLFLAAAGACLAVLPVNRGVGAALDELDVAPPRIVAHVAAVFLLPGLLLGAVSPVVVKLALEAGQMAGRSIGGVYSANALGSIAGTFATGFWLAPALPTSRIIWCVSGILALLGAACLLTRSAASVEEDRPTV